MSSIMTQNEASEEAIATLLDKIEEMAFQDPTAALAELEAAPPELAADPAVSMARADLTFVVHGPEAARTVLEPLLAQDPDDPDVRHMLGWICGELGEEERMVEHFLKVLELDRAIDGGDAVDRETEDRIVAAAEEALAGLPDPFRSRIADVAILVEPRPSQEIVREGFDPRALGLFEGPCDADRQNLEPTTTPTRIVLYSANLLADSPDPDTLRLEVQTTVLHEVGHYFGLDEEELDHMGLA